MSVHKTKQCLQSNHKVKRILVLCNSQNRYGDPTFIRTDATSPIIHVRSVYTFQELMSVDRLGHRNPLLLLPLADV